MKREKNKKRFRRLVEKVAYRVASFEANTACPFIGYQPKQPNAVKKLRKF